MTAAFNAGVVGYLIWEKEQDASNSAENVNNHAEFEVGPSNLFYDPTNTVTARMSKAVRG